MTKLSIRPYIGLYGARLSLAVWQHFTRYFLFTYYFVLSLKNKYTIPYHTNSIRLCDSTMFTQRSLYNEISSTLATLFH